MQVFVLGMHRTGTSTVARLLNMMGCYFGPEGIALDPAEDNQKGFWERRDVKQANDLLLQKNNATWSNISQFRVEDISEDSRDDFFKMAKKIVNGIDAHRPWMIKDPRNCITFSLWRSLLELPVCVQVFRNPYEVALSLKRRNSFPIAFSLALWEKYQLASIASGKGLPNIIIDYNELIADPVKVVNKFFEDLTAHQVTGIRKPGEEEILSFITKKLYHQRDDETAYENYLTSRQLTIYKQLKKGEIDGEIFELKMEEEEDDLLAIYDDALRLKKENKLVKGKLEETESQLREKEAVFEKLHREIESKNGIISNKKLEIDKRENQLRQLKLEKEIMLASRGNELSEIRASQQKNQTNLESLLSRQMASQDENFDLFLNKLKDLSLAIDEKINIIEELSSERKLLEEKLGEAKEEKTFFQKELEIKTKVSEEKIKKLQLTISDLNGDLKTLSNTLNIQDKELVNWQIGINGKLRHLLALVESEAQMIEDVGSLHRLNLSSWRWKIGNTIIRMVESILLRKRGPIAVEHMTSLLDNARNRWENLSEKLLEVQDTLAQKSNFIDTVALDRVIEKVNFWETDTGDNNRNPGRDRQLEKQYSWQHSGVEVNSTQLDKTLSFSKESKIASPLKITIISPSTNIHGGTKRLLMIAKLLHLRGHSVNFIRQYKSRKLDWFDLDVPVIDLFFDEHEKLEVLEGEMPNADILISYGNNRANHILDQLSEKKGKKFQLFMHFGIHDKDLDIKNAKLENFQSLCTTSWIKDQLIKLVNSRPMLIDFGVHNDQFFPTRSKRPFRIGTLYHKSSWKRTKDALLAYKLVTAEPAFKDLQLILYGQEPDPDLEGINCEYVFDPSQNQIRDIYSSCAAWVMPSLFEGIGMCSVEAMLCKTPLITVDTGGSRDFCNSNNAVIISKKAPKAIADGIKWVFQNPTQASEMAEIAYRDICTHTWSNSIDLLEMAIQEKPLLPSRRVYDSSSPQNNRVQLTIGIPIHNQLDYVKQCLQSIEENTALSYEIILVDDNSDQETYEFLAQQVNERTLHIRNSVQRGFPYNCNTILRHAKGEFICLLNSDTIVTKNWGVRLIEALQKNANLAMVGPSTSYGVAKNYDEVAQQLEEVHFKRFEMSYAEIQEFQKLNHQKVGSEWTSTEYINGFCMMLKSAVLPEIGFFDTEFGLGSREEVQYIDRIREEGYQVGWVKGAYVHHYGHRSFSSIADSKVLWQKNKELYFQTKGQRRHIGITKKKIGFIYNAKSSSSTRKRTFELIPHLTKFLDVDAIHWKAVDKAFFDEHEIVVLQRVGGLNEEIMASYRSKILQWIDAYQKTGSVFVYDIDDLVIHGQNDLPLSFIRQCNYVSTSTPRLADYLQKFNKNTVVLPNGIDYERFKRAKAVEFSKKKIRIICFSLAGAGVSAFDKIAEMLKNEEPSKFEFHLFSGQNLDNDRFKNIKIHKNLTLDELFGWLKSVDYVINWDHHTSEYFKKLRMQYGLLKEEEDLFVDCKSGLKYYNAAVSKSIFISTPNPVEYQRIVNNGETGFLVKTPEEVKSIIIELEKDNQRKEKILQRAYEDVIEKFTMENTIKFYLDFFNSIQ